MSERYIWLEPGHERISVPEDCVIGAALPRADHPCGGKGMCGKCRVRTRNGAEPLEAERALLTEAELREGWRLSCISPVRDGMSVWLPEDQGGMRILEGERTGGAAPQGLRGCRLGCDIGTTTVVLYLLHPESGAILHTVSALNGQVAFGGDVISRIFAVCEDQSRLEELQSAIVDTINGLLEKLRAETGADLDSIRELRVAGNTTMEHLLVRADPRGLGKSPFVPAFLEAPASTAGELGLALPPETPVTQADNLSAFIGGDITAGIYYTGMARQTGISLLLDIGTNNEMVLGNARELHGCSAAAGPALEGAQISTGMRAAAGAVEKVWRGGDDLCLRTIAGAPPRGLCGSGLIDLLALLVREGIVRPDGRFASPEDLPESALSSRLRRGGKRHSEFVYCRQGEYGAEQDLVLTQKDVREAQLAKSAIAVGIDKLLERMGIGTRDLEHVYLAGAFGNYIDQANARELGILPQVPDEVILPVRNSAGLGICRSLYDPAYPGEVRHIAEIFHPMNLAAEEDFQKRFLDRLKFGV